jgi:crotonobetainyl-CoA:carnitine CoA-transferase CaiB-like acyl-CoA transferase
LDVKPLKGKRIVDLTTNVPGPYATLLLSDLGAEVIKVEPPNGDPVRYLEPQVCGASLLFHCLNRGKRFLCLDLHNAKDKERILALISKSDCLVEGFRPGVLDHLGLSLDCLKAQNNNLIILRMSGYGQHGVYRDRAGHDLNFVGLSGALSGLSSLNPPPFLVADVGSALLACLLALSALFSKSEEGLVEIDCALLDGALAFSLPFLARAFAGEDTREGNGLLEGGLSVYKLYKDKDRGLVSVAALEKKFQDEITRIFGSVDANTLERGFSQIPRKRFFEDKPFASCVEPVLSKEEAKEHPAIRARNFFRSMKCEGRIFDLPVTLFASNENIPEGAWAKRLGADNSVVF